MTDPVTGTLRLTQPTVGGDSGSWGTILNSNLAYTDTGVNGITSISLSSNTYTLEAAGDSGDQARAAWYSFTGSPGANCTVTLPANDKIGIASNSVSGGYAVILTTGSGNTVTIDNGSTVMFYCDGTNVNLVPWGSPGTLPALSVSSASTLTVAEKGSYVEVALSGNYIIGLPTPVGHAGDSYLINFLSGSGTATLSTPAGSITGGYGLGTKTSLYVAGPVFMIVSDGTNWVTQGNAAVAATTVSATGAVTFGSTLNVTGSTSFAGNVTVAGTLNAGVLSGTSTTSSLSVGGTSNFVGSATFSSNINDLGTLTAAVIDVTGTSSLVGNVTAGANVIVTGTVTDAGEKNSGTSTMAVLDVTGTSSQVGLAIFGGNQQITGTSTMAVLDVTGTSSQVGAGTFGAALTVVGTLTGSADAKITGTVTDAGEKNTGTSTMAVLDVTGTSSMVGNVIMSGTGTMAVLDVTGTSSQVGAATFGANVTITGTETNAGMKDTGTATMAVLDVTGTSSQVGNATFGGNVTVTGTATASVISVTGTESLGGELYSAGIAGQTAALVPVGAIGEWGTASNSAACAISTNQNYSYVVVGPGNYMFWGACKWYGFGSSSSVGIALSTATNSTSGFLLPQAGQVNSVGFVISDVCLSLPASPVLCTATTTICLNGANSSSGGGTFASYLAWLRIG